MKVGKGGMIVWALVLALGLLAGGCGGGGSSDRQAVIPVTDNPDTDTPDTNDPDPDIGDISPPGNGPELDVLYLIDESGSVDIRIVQHQRSAILESLSTLAADVAVGVAGFCDFPISPWGSEGDEPFSLLQPVTRDRAEAAAGFAALATESQGGDTPESQLEALYRAAIGGDDVSPVGWRTGALRVIVLLTDAPFHDPTIEPDYPGATMAETIAALQEAGIMVVGIAVGETPPAQFDPLPQINQITTATDGVATRIPADGAGLLDFLRSTFAELAL